MAKLQRKLERSKKIEAAGAADEVLLEEIKEYKVSSGHMMLGDTVPVVFYEPPSCSP